MVGVLYGVFQYSYFTFIVLFCLRLYFLDFGKSKTEGRDRDCSYEWTRQITHPIIPWRVSDKNIPTHSKFPFEKTMMSQIKRHSFLLSGILTFWLWLDGFGVSMKSALFNILVISRTHPETSFCYRNFDSWDLIGWVPKTKSWDINWKSLLRHFLSFQKKFSLS